ncbi:MAG: hypothetical protein O2968_01940 [Acidobacteria bacterium]|nr:hypothetical protein [Acidobacteriota bacterium]
MLRHVPFLASRPSKGGGEDIEQQRQRLPGFHDSITRSVMALAATPRAVKFVTASAGIPQL